MMKEFNVTGWCDSGQHYMADISGKVHQVLQLVYRGKYFIINRPRQYGKTTMLYTLDSVLGILPDYLVFSISFEGIGSEAYLTEKQFCASFLHLLHQQMIEKEEDTLEDFIIESQITTTTLIKLSAFITQLVIASKKQLVLLIDEVDKSSNNQLFLDFLGVLRNKYLIKHLKTQKTFHAVILTGVHDIKTLKQKIRADQTTNQLNSPWNIATEFKVSMSLSVEEIIPMLVAYAKDRSVELNPQEIAAQLVYYTSGYPFLVSYICKIVDEDIVPFKEKKEITAADIIKAVDLLLQTTNTNFDSLKKNLTNDPKLYQLAYNVAVNGSYFPYNIHQPTIEKGVMYGVFGKSPKGKLAIHNRIYREVIYDFMSLQMLETLNIDKYLYQPSYILPNKELNVEKVILKFQELLKEQYSKKDRDFIERQGRLLFLAFLKPIINGSGYSFKEPQISEEKRLDIAITFYQHSYIIELKIWRGPKAHQEGLKQLADYLDKQGLTTGYLVIFDQRVKKSWAQEWLKVDGKRIFAVWV